MKTEILASTIILALVLASSLIIGALEPEINTPLADTYVDAYSATSPKGEKDHLEVADYAGGLSIALLMFDLSEFSHPTEGVSEIQLRLYCFHVDSPHVVGVHWCVNNTWKEENLTIASFGGFLRTAPESALLVDDEEVWYEWKVTSLISEAFEEDYERVTLTLEVEDSRNEMARSLYASKDQPTQEMREYCPQLVFRYGEREGVSLNLVLIVLGLAAVAVVYLVYRFYRGSIRKRPRRRARPRPR